MVLSEEIQRVYDENYRVHGVRKVWRDSLRRFSDMYADFMLARLEIHDTTNSGIYFKGWGSEFYGQYRVSDRLWIVGEFNALEPDSDQDQARYYRVRYAVTGLRCTFDKFRRMMYANVRMDDSLNEVGTPRANVYTVGILWDLSKQGMTHIQQEIDRYGRDGMDAH